MTDDEEPLARQLPLPLAPPPRTADEPLVPARMLNEWVYCPRLAWLEWVESEWAESADTAEGRRLHGRFDPPAGRLPAPGALDDPAVMRGKVHALTLSSDKLGIVAKMDVIEHEDDAVTPVDVKRGKRPHIAGGVHDPERVQLCAQTLVLEEAGYRVREAAIWFAGSRERVPVAIDDELRQRTFAALADIRLAVAAGCRPPPLTDSPKCVRCSLAGICLPDETNWFLRSPVPPRPLNPADDPTLPLHGVSPGSRLRKSGATLVVEADDERREVPLIAVSDVSLYGPVSVTTPALHALLRQGSSIAWFSTGGWFLGTATSGGPRNAVLREAQYRAAFDEHRRLAAARSLVAAKIRNQRTILRRNARKVDPATDAARIEVLDRLGRLARKAAHAKGHDTLLGIEGEAAALYFRHFADMLTDEARELGFAFEKRNRRPPVDEINALLSFTYALTTRLFTAVLATVGLDPWFGFYHARVTAAPRLPST